MNNILPETIKHLRYNQFCDPLLMENCRFDYEKFIKTEMAKDVLKKIVDECLSLHEGIMSVDVFVLSRSELEDVAINAMNYGLNCNE